MEQIKAQVEAAHREYLDDSVFSTTKVLILHKTLYVI
jgi:hypothetical protein